MFNKSVVLALTSTITQYYNYALFGISANILSKHFIGNDDSFLVKFFSIFAISVLTRPIGSFIFGIIGDMYGRSVAMKLSAFTITMSAMIIYLSYSHDHNTGIVLLFLSRILLVISIAGETDGVRIYLTEIFEKKDQYFANGLIIASTQIGVLLAFLISYLIEIYDSDFKISFLIGSLLGIVVLTFRSYFVETEFFIQNKFKNKISFTYVMKKIWENKKFFIISAVLFGAMGGIYQFYIIFMNSYLRLMNLAESKFISIMHIAGVAAFGISAIASGYIADRFQLGFKQVYAALYGLLLISFVNYICLHMMRPEVLLFMFAVVLIPVYMVIIEIYIRNNVPKETLYTVYSVSHSVGSVVFSGTTPLICSILWKKTGIISAPYLYLFVLIVLIITCIAVIGRLCENKN